MFALTMGASPSFADSTAKTQVAKTPGANATVEPTKAVPGQDVFVAGKKVPTMLQKLQLSNGTLVPSYCTDFSIQVKVQAALVEDDWAGYSGAAAGISVQFSKVNWIVHHSYPTVTSLLSLQKLAGIQLISEKEAIAATQLAIWHFTNGINPDSAHNNLIVLQLYAFLVGGANIGDALQPISSLSLIPAGPTAGLAGDKFGPFLVRTTARLVPLTLTAISGVQLVNAQGKTVHQVINGEKVWVKVAAGLKAGKATIRASVDLGLISAGRLFHSVGNLKAQPVITAGEGQAPVLITVVVTWGGGDKGGTTGKPTQSAPGSTAKPTPSTAVSEASGSLPITGTNVALFGAVGAALLLLGGGLFFFARRKRSA
ncbi:thioester domain-containing protein [Fodinicola feengrottensis]|uniref:thioester domain-containing protein n=1 Tax=Fodinicola feengrottensis TaxID=435914 RepID=UPI0031D9338D